jgi:hypothetical protein
MPSVSEVLAVSWLTPGVTVPAVSVRAKVTASGVGEEEKVIDGYPKPASNKLAAKMIIIFEKSGLFIIVFPKKN